MYIVLIPIVIVVAIAETVKPIKSREFGNLAVYCFISGITLLIIILLISDVKVLSPVKLIERMMSVFIKGGG